MKEGSGRTAIRGKCPHCGTVALIRKMEKVDSAGLGYTGVMECQDIDCGFRAFFDLSIICTLTESKMPNKKVNLPLSPRKKCEEESK
ncbi:transcriptional regulator [Phytohalomonas tamaricis]|uniref:transcriptional regulator n=1 Tax=Phytohalomonas tamaricis TaxID=2081032 RepID=UPI00131A32A1|nr:transcriptional regulator [Phytohalomonas tamaricis]